MYEPLIRLRLVFTPLGSFFVSNPEYEVTFVSPYSNEKIEWLFNKEYRIARIKSDVVSYIDYGEQNVDDFLTSQSFFDMREPSSITNCIDTSLFFKIDALGDGYNRAPINTGSMPYSGELTDFNSDSTD